MYKNTLFRGAVIRSVISFSLMYLLYSCTEIASPVPEAYSVNGKVTFVDSNFVQGGGYYVAAAYLAGNWTSRTNPTYSAPIIPRKVNDSTILEYPYKITSVHTGDNIVDIEYIDTVSGRKPVMGVYGCDTSHASSCYLNPPLHAILVTTSGVLNIDFKTWADTSKRIY